MKQWNIGNTTVRNPERIREGLKVLNDHFKGKIFDENAQVSFARKLAEKEVTKPFGENTSEKSIEITGRKWASVMNQLGFAVAWKTRGVVRVTDAGKALITDPYSDEVFLRQFITYRLPNPIENGSEFSNFDLHPLYVMLRSLLDAHDLGIKGLRKQELALFVVPCIRDEHAVEIARSAKAYREEYAGVTGKQRKRTLFSKYQQEIIYRMYEEDISQRSGILKSLHLRVLEGNASDIESSLSTISAFGKGTNTKNARRMRRDLEVLVRENKIEEAIQRIVTEYVSIKGRTLLDYADTIVRYFSLTGLFTISGSIFKLKDERIEIARALAEQIASRKQHVGDEYLKEFYSADAPKIPSDSLKYIETEKRRLEETLGIAGDQRIPSDTRELKIMVAELRKRRQSQEEESFYRSLSERAKVEETKRTLQEVSENHTVSFTYYRPAMYEWAIWRSFLTINHIQNGVSDSRNFELDEENNPVHHAKAGQPDMIFEYENRTVIVEATLLTSSRQGSEYEPVREHLARYVKEGKNAMCVFIAPSIVPDTAAKFLRTPLYAHGEWKGTLDIVMLTTDQLVSILDRFIREPYGPPELLGLLDQILESRENHNERTVPDWLRETDRLIASWASNS
jgi:hypothetical protein